MPYFVYKLTPQSLNEYQTVCSSVYKTYTNLTEQLALLSQMVDDESELESTRKSIQETQQCLNTLHCLIKRPDVGDYSLPIERSIVNFLMSELKDSGREFEKFFSNFELREIKIKAKPKNPSLGKEMLRMQYLHRVRNEVTTATEEKTIEKTNTRRFSL